VLNFENKPILGKGTLRMNSIVDLSRIQETSDGDAEFERELLAMFLEDAEGQTHAIARLAGNGDFDELKKAAHTLKGSSANIGAVRLQETALGLERAAAQESGADVASLVGQLQSVFADTKKRYEDYLAALS